MKKLFAILLLMAATMNVKAQTGENEPITVTLSADGYASYCSDVALDFTSIEGLGAYIATSTANDVVTLKKQDYVPALTGIILKGQPSATYVLKSTEYSEPSGTNLLIGVSERTLLPSNSYVLANVDGVSAFYLAGDGLYIPAHKAFLKVQSGGGANRARSFNFSFDDGTTDVEKIEKSNTATTAQAYNLSGQKVNSDYKGIVIIGGKKIVRR